MLTFLWFMIYIGFEVIHILSVVTVTLLLFIHIVWNVCKMSQCTFRMYIFVCNHPLNVFNFCIVTQNIFGIAKQYLVSVWHLTFPYGVLQISVWTSCHKNTYCIIMAKSHFVGHVIYFAHREPLLSCCTFLASYVMSGLWTNNICSCLKKLLAVHN